MFCLLVAAVIAASPVVSAQDLCISTTNTYTAVVDLFASELGYFTFEECPGKINPTIGLTLGESYTFLQTDRSNWLHPLGFAYLPDGAHADEDELEPGISQTGSACVDTFSCPTPRYLKDGEFLGVNGTDDFGLDVYEPEFFANPVDWTAAGNYSIELTFDDADYAKDIFYFCHIHQFMSGRIKILDSDGNAVSSTDDPPLGYEYDMPSEFDKTCGTFGLEPYQLPNALCPSKFVCGVDEVNQDLQDFSACIDAMNCAMLAGMTTGVKASDPTALFIHQMIPHHQNAVNMAKTLLIENNLDCPDLTNEETPGCIMEVMLREIINGQNHQIQKMLGVLEELNFPVSDNCIVELDTSIREIEEDSTNVPTGAPTGAPSGADHKLMKSVTLLAMGSIVGWLV